MICKNRQVQTPARGLRGIVNRMFDTILVRPIFNILTFIYAVIPGHDFGLALILFTVVMRFAIWPIAKKQLHHTKAMRQLQPEIKRIKQETKGDKQRESLMTMALYKERSINPFSPIGLMFVQLPILFALFAGINKIVKDPGTVISFSYDWVQNLPWMKEVAANISKFDNSLFGLVDLNRHVIGDNFYWPAFLIVIASSATQYFTSKQLAVSDKDAKSLRSLLKEAGKTGQQADQAEVSAAVGGMMRFIIPGMIFFISIGLSAAISLYWLVGGVVAYLQQKRILNDDKLELEAVVGGARVTAEIIEKPKNQKTNKKKRSAARRKKRR